MSRSSQAGRFNLYPKDAKFTAEAGRAELTSKKADTVAAGPCALLLQVSVVLQKFVIG